VLGLGHQVSLSSLFVFWVKLWLLDKVFALGLSCWLLVGFVSLLGTLIVFEFDSSGMDCFVSGSSVWFGASRRSVRFVCVFGVRLFAC